MQIRKLASTLSFVVFCSLSLPLMSFTDGHSTNTGDPKKSDSVSTSKSFKNLFSDIPGSVMPGIGTISIPLNPAVLSFVNGFIKRETEEYGKMKIWAKTYFDLYDKVLSNYNIPTQLKYLSVIESHLQKSLISSAGAVGPWQLMPDEAKRYGLRTGKYDERKDYAKSTIVAAQLLSKLYKDFGDWLLVIAAYNAGEGRVRQAIKKAGSANYWKIQNYLPDETRNHVKKFIATHYFFEGNGGITTATAEELKKYKPADINNSTINKDELANTVTVEIQGKFNSTVMAKYLQITMAALSRLNPRLDDALLQGNVYNLRLPADKLSLFQQQKQQILRESVQLLISPSAFNSSK